MGCIRDLVHQLLALDAQGMIILAAILCLNNCRALHLQIVTKIAIQTSHVYT